MIKVRILSGVTVAGAAAVALTTLPGCAADAQTEVETGTDNNTQAIAGSGELAVHGTAVYYSSRSGGDEFIRVGEKLRATIDFGHLVNILVGWEDTGLGEQIKSDPSKLAVTLKVSYTKADGSKFDVPAIPVTVAPGSGNILAAVSDEFVVPNGVSRVRFDFIGTFDKFGTSVTLGALERAGFGFQSESVVFGAHLPNKLALFDTAGSDRRSRIVEGGAFIKGAHATLSYTDWRADTVVDKATLDLRIGERRSNSRFGESIIPALGALEYEVSAQVSTDGGQNWFTVPFTKQVHPDVLARADGWRFALEAHLALAQNAGPNMKIAFNVKAFLQVPDYRPGDISNARYAPNTRVLLRDSWDNNGGQNYALPIGGQ